MAERERTNENDSHTFMSNYLFIVIPSVGRMYCHASRKFRLALLPAPLPPPSLPVPLPSPKIQRSCTSERIAQVRWCGCNKEGVGNAGWVWAAEHPYPASGTRIRPTVGAAAAHSSLERGRGGQGREWAHFRMQVLQRSVRRSVKSASQGFPARADSQRCRGPKGGLLSRRSFPPGPAED